MEYKLIVGTDLLKFQEEINELMSEGWIPQGGVSVVSDVIGTRFCQSMVIIK